MISSCEEDDIPSQLDNPCGEFVEISSTKYESGFIVPVIINTIFLENNCLFIAYNTCGFTGDTSELELVDSGDAPETLVPTRNLRLIYKDDESEKGSIEKTAIFNVSNLGLPGSNSLLLQIGILQCNDNGLTSEDNFSLLYEY